MPDEKESMSDESENSNDEFEDCKDQGTLNELIKKKFSKSKRKSDEIGIDIKKSKYLKPIND